MTQERQRTVRTGARQGALRVLVVDDHADVRLLVRRVLTMVDTFEVVGEAADGSDAIRAAAELQPDVVLLDLAMPGMDGHQALPTLATVAADSMITIFSASLRADQCDELQAIGAFRCYDKLELPRLAELLERDYEDFRTA